MLDRKLCPDCGSSLGKGAYKCRCGWKAAEGAYNPTTRIDCAFDSCMTPALVRVQTRTGWANLCTRHYETQHQSAAAAYAEKHGLKTPADHLRHMRKLASTPKDPRAWMRNPKSKVAAEWAEQILNRQVRHVEQEQPELETAVNF